MVEQGTHKPLDVGSNPTLAIFMFKTRVDGITREGDCSPKCDAVLNFQEEVKGTFTRG